VNAAATLTLVSALVALAVGVRSHRMGLAPGSGEQRWFTVVVLASAAYALCNLSSTLPASDAAVVFLGGVEIGILAVLLWGWIRFAQEFTEVTPGRWERLAANALLASAPVLALPGLVFQPSIREYPFALLGVRYRQAVPTPVGDVILAGLCLAAALVLVRLVRAARRGVRHAAVVSVGYATMLVFAAWDAICVTLQIPRVPFTLDWGFAPAVIAVDWMNTSRLIETTRALAQLRAELQGEVDRRSRELSTALDRLHHSEKLVSLGRFANGVAHQVNNPAAVVSSCLSFLAGSASPRLQPNEADALADARAANERISVLVRRLVDAARVAEARHGDAAADVSSAIAKVVGLQPAAARAVIRVKASPAFHARVRIRPDALEVVIDTLVRHALGAASAAAPHVEVETERVDGRIRVTVTDRGPVLTRELLDRAFDPFFSTAARGTGGVGLAVARHLAQANGGTLVLESAPGAGTRAILEVPEEHPSRDEYGLAGGMDY
jgi:signal transduction histidine kinase